MSWARGELRGFDAIGIVEVACYSNLIVPTLGFKNDPIIAFHVHVVVLDADERKLNAMKARINAGHKSLVPGRPAALVQSVKPGTLRTLLHYMAKSPSWDYRVWQEREEWRNKGTGEIVEKRTGRPRQNSKPASKKLHLLVREVTARFHLDKMIFATGRGVDTLKSVRKDALRGLPWSMRSGRQHKFSSKLPTPLAVKRNMFGGWIGGDDFNREEALARVGDRHRVRRAAIKMFGAAEVEAWRRIRGGS